MVDGSLLYQPPGHPSHGGNEAEIFILAILGGKISVLGGEEFFYYMNILIFEGYQFRNGDDGGKL